MWVTALFVLGLFANFSFAWKTLPYFPIEISYTLKATKLNVYLNLIVVLSFPWILKDVFPEMWVRVWVMMGVCFLAYDDHRFNIHQVAVYHLLAIFLLNMLYYCGWKTTLAFIFFYLFRGLSKLYLVSSLLMHKPLNNWIRAPLATFLESYKFITQERPSGHPVLKLGAIWQWIVWITAVFILEHKLKL